jgi:hypothetical protein
MQAQDNVNCKPRERGKGSKEYKLEDEKESHVRNPNDEEPVTFTKRKSSLKEIKRRGSFAVNASFQKLFGEKERSYYFIIRCIWPWPTNQMSAGKIQRTVPTQTAMTPTYSRSATALY